MALLLGIDLGTSSVKVALVESDTLQVVAQASQDYPIDCDKPGYAEQNPEHWWQAVIHSARAVAGVENAREIRGIGLSGQMHGLVCLDNAHKPIGPAIIWADTRSAGQVEALSRFQASHAIALPGPPAVGFAASSALWLSQNAPDVLKRTRCWLMPKDYLRVRLTGTLGTDPSDASASWLYDVAADAWNTPVAEYCGIQPAQMPPVASSETIAGELTAEAAEQLKLPPGIPVVAGSGDLPAQALGHGIVDEGTALITIGTGGQVFVPLSAPRLDERLRYYTFRHNVPDRWYAQAAILAGGLSLSWLSDILGQSEKDFESLSQMAAAVPPGAQGLIFLPYLAGERSPHMDPLASGVLLGLRLHHTRSHIVRAVMEGVSFAIKDCLLIVSDQEKQYDRVILSGGVSRSTVWRQILADILEVNLHIADTGVPYGCIGAALLAGVGTGIYADIAGAVNRLPDRAQVVQPEPSKLYRDRYALYKRLYPALKSEMHHLADTGIAH